MHKHRHGFTGSRLLAIAVMAASLGVLTPLQAAIFDGGGLEEGLQSAQGLQGPVDADARSLAVNALRVALSFLALVAVIVVVIAGIYLILGQGSDDSKEKAKKIIFYTIIGLIIILFARLIVGFFSQGLPGELS